MPRVARSKKNPNGAGTDARRRKDGRYETCATLDTPTGRRQVSFYVRTAQDANDAKFAALSDQSKGVLFSDPQRLTVSVITPTKTGEERTVGIGPRTVEILKKHRSRQLEERMAATSWEDPGWVFPNTRGKVRRRDSVMRSL